MPAFPEPPPHRAEETVALRRVAERDIPEILIAHQDDGDLARRLGLARPPSGAELGRRVEASAAPRAGGGDMWLTVTADGSDVCCGQLELRDLDADPRRGELTVWIVSRRRGEGLGGAALAVAGRWLLAEAGLERVALLVDPREPAIHRAAERAGFRSEGILRGYTLGPGGRSDAEVLSLIGADLTGVDADPT